MTVREYQVENLDCAGCSAKIEGEIANLTEVKTAHLDLLNKKLVVEFATPLEDDLLRFNKIADGIEPGVKISEKGSPTETKESKYKYLIYSGLILLLATYFLPFSPLLIAILSILSYLMVAGRVLRSAVKEVFAKQLMAEHFLMSIASIGAIYLGEYTEAIAVMALYELGQYLEHKALSHSRKAVQSILALKPEFAHLQTPDGIQDKKLSEIQIGNTLLIYPYERVPLDGIVQKGESTLDTSSISGESEPAFVSQGSQIFAGCLNQSGLLEYSVSHTESESMVSRIMNLIENATARKAPQERFITRFASYYTPIVVLLALLVFLIPSIMGYSSALWFKRALVFLIVSCPCALVISIPLSYYIGIGVAAKKGIIFKGSVYLDRLRAIKTMVYDKTGTLTTGNLMLNELITTDDARADELKEGLYLSEYTSSHPFARGVKSAFKYTFDSSKVKVYAEFPGKGVLIEYETDKYFCGSIAFLKEHGFLSLIDTDGKSAIHLVKNDVYLGCAIFSDEIKPGMIEAVEMLHQMGVEKQIMLSGDRLAKAAAIAANTKLDEYYAELFPSQKLEKLEEIIAQTTGLVAYVGDGLNDAPVLARADIGIAMGGIGAEASIESADIVLLNDRPQQLVTAIQLSHKTNSIVWQNIGLALGIKIIVMALGIGGISGLWEAIIADVGVSLLVIFNSLRLLRVNTVLDKKQPSAFLP